MIKKIKLFIAFCIYYNILVNSGMKKDEAKSLATTMAAMVDP
jgi:hypothetical protein